MYIYWDIFDVLLNIYIYYTIVKFVLQELISQSNVRNSRGRYHMVVGFTTTYTYMQSVPITTDVVSSNLDQGEVYRWFSPGAPVSSTNKSYRLDIAEILLKVALKHHQTNKHQSNVAFKMKHDM